MEVPSRVFELIAGERYRSKAGLLELLGEIAPRTTRLKGRPNSYLRIFIADGSGMPTSESLVGRNRRNQKSSFSHYTGESVRKRPGRLPEVT